MGGWFWSKCLVQNDYYYNNRPKSIPHKCCFTPINLSKQNFIPWKDNFLLLMLSMNCWPILVVYHLSCFWHHRCVVVYWHKRDWLISLLSLPPLIIRGRLMPSAFRHWGRFCICCLLIVWDWPNHWSIIETHDASEEVNVMFWCRPCTKRKNRLLH